MNDVEKVKLRAPIPGSCRICATVHDPSLPHDRDSLYYQMRFYQIHKRMPTWNDAMAHCSGTIQLQALQTLMDHGVIPENKETNGPG